MTLSHSQEKVRRDRIEEGEPGDDWRRRGEHLRIQSATKWVGSDVVEVVTADDRGSFGDRVEEPLDTGAHALRSLTRSICRLEGIGGLREVEEVRGFGLVELQGGGERAEHGVGDSGEIATPESDVVINADPREKGNFFAAKPVDAPVAAVCRESSMLWGDAVAPRGEELAHITAVIHANHATYRPAAQGGSVSTGYICDW